MNDFIDGIATWLTKTLGLKTKNPKRLALLIMLILFVGIQVLLVLALL